jgi:hypothetical protein
LSFLVVEFAGVIRTDQTVSGPARGNSSRMIAAGADIYVRRWQQYAKGLRRIG